MWTGMYMDEICANSSIWSRRSHYVHSSRYQYQQDHGQTTFPTWSQVHPFQIGLMLFWQLSTNWATWLTLHHAGIQWRPRNWQIWCWNIFGSYTAHQWPFSHTKEASSPPRSQHNFPKTLEFDYTSKQSITPGLTGNVKLPRRRSKSTYRILLGIIRKTGRCFCQLLSLHTTKYIMCPYNYHCSTRAMCIAPCIEGSHQKINTSWKSKHYSNICNLSRMIWLNASKQRRIQLNGNSTRE